MLDARQRRKLIDLFPPIAVDGAFVDELAATAVAVTLPAGQTICHQGDRCYQTFRDGLIPGNLNIFAGNLTCSDNHEGFISHLLLGIH